MKGLKELCIQGDNPRLIHDLAEALINVKVGLLLQLCEGMEGVLKKKIDLPPRTEFSNISRNVIDGYVRRWSRHGEFGLYYPLEGYSGAHLGMCMWPHGILLGIQCGKSYHLDTYTKLGEMMRNSGMQGHDAEWWPWRKRPDLLPEKFNRDSLSDHRWEHVEFLQERGKDLAENIAEDLKRVWDTVHGNTPA